MKNNRLIFFISFNTLLSKIQDGRQPKYEINISRESVVQF